MDWRGEQMKTVRRIWISSVGWARTPGKNLTLFSLLAPILLLAAPAAGELTFEIAWTKGRLSVTAEAAPLGELLVEVARRTGTRIDNAESIRNQVTLSFSGLALREGLRRLLAFAENYAIVEESLTTGEYRPTLVRFIGPHLSGTELRPSVTAAQPIEAETSASTDELPGARLDRFLADLDPSVRRGAVERLADIGDEWGFSRLMAALRDQNSTVREAAVTALGPYGPQAIEPVTALLKTETHSEVRIAAMQMLGQFSRPELAGLFHGMLGDADPRIRRAAVEGLNQTEGSTASEALRTAALDQDAEVRTAALDALGIYGRDPKLAIDGALAHGDKTTQSIAAELRGNLMATGRWDSLEATPDDQGFKTESPLYSPPAVE